MDVIRRVSGRQTRATENPTAALVWYNAGTALPPGVMELRRFDLEPGGDLPMHEHNGPDHEVLIPLRGQFEVLCGDGERAVIGVGDVVVSTPGQAHAVRNVTDEPAELLIFATPSRKTAPAFVGAAAQSA